MGFGQLMYLFLPRQIKFHSHFCDQIILFMLSFLEVFLRKKKWAGLKQTKKEREAKNEYFSVALIQTEHRKSSDENSKSSSVR